MKSAKKNLRLVAKILAIILPVIVLYYCFNYVFPVFCRISDYFDLGNGYRYSPDSPQWIIDENNGLVAEGYLYHYNYNDTYIIAVTKKRGKEEKFYYWIINKKTQEYLQFTDSLEMVRQKEQLGILLDFKPSPLRTY